MGRGSAEWSNTPRKRRGATCSEEPPCNGEMEEREARSFRFCRSRVSTCAMHSERRTQLLRSNNMTQQGAHQIQVCLL